MTYLLQLMSDQGHVAIKGTTSGSVAPILCTIVEGKRSYAATNSNECWTLHSHSSSQRSFQIDKKDTTAGKRLCCQGRRLLQPAIFIPNVYHRLDCPKLEFRTGQNRTRIYPASLIFNRSEGVNIMHVVINIPTRIPGAFFIFNDCQFLLQGVQFLYFPSYNMLFWFQIP